jgi:ATP-dependent RNA helicase HelY
LAFDRICALLAELGYLTPDGGAVAAPGERLRRLYTEKDLLAAECLREGLWERLDPPGLAAVVSTLVHEPRRDDAQADARMPTPQVQEALEAMTELGARIEARQRAIGLPATGAPDAGIAWMVHRWANGRRLDAVLRDSQVAAGDFVRACKQVVDLLDQVADCAPTPALAATARKAVAGVLRGVVAADRLD